MPKLTIGLTSDSLKELELQATAGKTTPELRAAHHLELVLADTRRFPDGVIKAGCERVVATLKQLPGVQRLSWSGIAYRHWWVRFEISTSMPQGWDTVRRLGYWINTESVEMEIYASFRPVPSSDDKGCIEWEIHSTEAMWDPADLAQWLEGRIQGTRS